MILAMPTALQRGNSLMNIILSIDYEIFGDGSGCMDSCMVKPLDNILNLCSQYGALLSIFAETMEISAFQASNLRKSEADLVCQQLQQASKEGHDVQLHLHPQWQDASFSQGQLNPLDSNKWRIANLGIDEQTQLIKTGKEWLENLIRPVCADYQCVAFRAGGWCIQPSHSIIQSLQENNIAIDSTVAPGAKNNSRADWFNFSKAPQMAYWKVDTDVLEPALNGIYELPITTSKIGILNHLGIILDRMTNDLPPHGCEGSYSIPGVNESRLFSKLKKLSNLGHVMLDISTMPANALIKITENWQRKFPDDPDVTAVAIGHTKNFSTRSALEFEKYLDWAVQQNHQFTTYQQWLKKH